MRFITEFELHIGESKDYVSFREFRSAQDLGVDISKALGWEKFGSLSLIPGALAKLNYKLEIEAFPMDKWIEFRKRLLAALPDYDATSRIRIENALHDLESFGKPEQHKESK